MSALNAGPCRPGIILCLAVLLASQSNSGKFSSESTRKIFSQKNPLAPQDFYLPFRLASTNCMYTLNASERNSFGGEQVYVR